MVVKKVILPASELKKIEEDRSKWLTQNVETGEYLFGRLHANRAAEVTHVIDRGPHAERTTISFLGDNEYETRVRDELRKENNEILLLGEYHLHPWEDTPTLSYGDIEQLKVAKRISYKQYRCCYSSFESFA